MTEERDRKVEKGEGGNAARWPRRKSWSQAVVAVRSRDSTPGRPPGDQLEMVGENFLKIFEHVTWQRIKITKMASRNLDIPWYISKSQGRLWAPVEVPVWTPTAYSCCRNNKRGFHSLTNAPPKKMPLFQDVTVLQNLHLV